MEFARLYIESFICYPISWIIPLICILIFWLVPGFIFSFIFVPFKTSRKVRFIFTGIFMIAILPFSKSFIYSGEYDGEFITQYAFKKLKKMPENKRKDSIEYKYVLLKFIDCDWEARLDTLSLTSLIDEKTIMKDMLKMYRKDTTFKRKAVILHKFVGMVNIDLKYINFADENICYKVSKLNIPAAEKAIIPVAKGCVYNNKCPDETNSIKSYHALLSRIPSEKYEKVIEESCKSQPQKCNDSFCSDDPESIKLKFKYLREYCNKHPQECKE